MMQTWQWRMIHRRDAEVAEKKLALALIFGLCVVLFAGSARGASHAKVSAVFNATGYRAGDTGMLAVVAEVDAGLHAQSNTPSGEGTVAYLVTPDANAAVDFSPVVYPRGEDVTYPALGKLNVYTGKVVVFVPFRVHADAGPGVLKLSGKMMFQICSDRFCFAPEQPGYEAQTKVVAPGEAATPAESELFAAMPTSAPTTAPTGMAAPVTPSSVGGEPAEAHGFGWAIGVALVAGLLFNVMPCVLPVLPLKAIGFYEVSQHERGKCLMLGLVFSLGLVTVFAILATLVLALKLITWGALFSKPWFIWTIVAVLVAMAFGLFGAFTTNLPTAIYRFTPRHDTYGGNFGMGALTAVLATPCTAPLLPPLLLWAATQRAIVGVVAITTVGVGMALPYLLLSAFPGLARRMPRTGPWPELFKQMMGFMLLVAAAVFGAGQLIAGPAFWWPAVVVVAIACGFMVIRSMKLAQSRMPIVVSVVLALAFTGASVAWAAQVNGFFETGRKISKEEEAARWQPYTPEAFATARSEGKVVLVKFTANWCLTCQYIEGTVFRDQMVWDTLKKDGVVAMKADMTKENPAASELLMKLNPAGGIPLTAIYPVGSDTPRTLASVYSSGELLKTLGSVEGR